MRRIRLFLDFFRGFFSSVLYGFTGFFKGITYFLGSVFGNLYSFVGCFIHGFYGLLCRSGFFFRLVLAGNCEKTQAGDDGHQDNLFHITYFRLLGMQK